MLYLRFYGTKNKEGNECEGFKLKLFYSNKLSLAIKNHLLLAASIPLTQVKYFW